MGRNVTHRDLRSFSFLLLIYAAFFASGASSLCAEVTWNRMLIVVVGNSLSATAMIIVVFMGGLGLGSYVGGNVIARRSSSLVPYVLLEIAIGAYILLSPSLFELLSHVFSALAGSAADRISLNFVRVMVTMTALFLPACLMGATFPAVISGAAPDSSAQRMARPGFLYSINTLGAAAGCFVGGYHLLFEFGVQAAIYCAFALNVAAGLCALLARMVKKPSLHEVEVLPKPDSSSPLQDDALRRFLNIATFGLGFVALAYEVFLTRMVILFLNNVASTFAIVLTGFLLGSGIGAVLGTWLYGVLSRTTQHANKLFGCIALAAAVQVIVTPYVIMAAAYPWQALLIIITPMIFIGALLPVAIRMLQPEQRDEATREAATLYALNTIGGVLGAGLVNHFLVPRIGLQGGLICLALICALAGFVNLLSPGRSRSRWVVTFLGIALLGVILGSALPSMKDMYTGKIAEWTRAQFVKIQLFQEGRAANVTVIDQQDPERGTFRDMYLNGIEEASTRFYHTQLFKLLGILPVLAHGGENPKNALVIAFGAGITAGSVLASDEVRSLDVVDINPDVEGINDLFKEQNGDVFHQPRFHFHNDDGRNYLVTSGKSYDLIISDSTHPCAYDSWILYTQQFYRAVKERLRPGGVFAQWVPVTSNLRGDLFRIHLNTFRSVFPNATFWYVYGWDQALLLATPEPFAFDTQRIQQKLDRLPDWFRAGEYQIDTVARLAGFFWLDATAMQQMIGHETRVNTDNLHYFEKQSALKPSSPEWQLPSFQASILPYLNQTNDALSAAIRREQKVAQLVGRFGFYRNEDDLLAAFCLMPQNGNVRYWMSLVFAGRLPEVSCQQ